MNEQELLLCCLAEECAEVAQRVSKALRFGLSEVQPGQDLDNAARITGELVDLNAVLTMLMDAGALPHLPMETAPYEAKREKVRKYMAYSLGQAPHPHANRETSGNSPTDGNLT